MDSLPETTSCTLVSKTIGLLRLFKVAVVTWRCVKVMGNLLSLGELWWAITLRDKLLFPVKYYLETCKCHLLILQANILFSSWKSGMSWFQFLVRLSFLSLYRCWIFKPQNFGVISQLNIKEVSFLISLFKKKKRKKKKVIFVSLLRKQWSFFLVSLQKKIRNEPTLNCFMGNCSFREISWHHLFLLLTWCVAVEERFCASSPSSNIRTFPFLNYCFTKAFPNLVRQGKGIFLR